MSRVGDSWTSYDTLFAEPFPEEADPSFSVQQQQFDFPSEKPLPFSKRSISPPISPEKTTHVFNSRKQKRPLETDPVQKKQKSAATIPASLEVKEKDNRQKALEQFHALFRDHPPPGPTSPSLADRYYNAINLKFPTEFNNFEGIRTDLRRYEQKYKKPCPDVDLDPEIAATFIGSGMSKKTKEAAVSIIKACLTYQSDFGLQNYIDIACQLLEVKESSEKEEIKRFYHSNKDNYPAAQWTSELEQQVVPLMKKMFSDVFVDEILGQYAALKGDDLAVSILSKAYKEEFEGKLKEPYTKIRRWIKARPLPEKVPPLNDKVKEVAKTIRREGGKVLSLQKTEIASVVGHLNATYAYCHDTQIAIERHLELAKKASGVSISVWCIRSYYDRFKDDYPPTSLSAKTKAELDTLKKEIDAAAKTESNRDQALRQYGALLAYTNSTPSLKNVKHFNAINSKWPGVFSSIDALRVAYRRAPKTAPLDPDIQKAFDESD